MRVRNAILAGWDVDAEAVLEGDVDGLLAIGVPPEVDDGVDSAIELETVG